MLIFRDIEFFSKMKVLVSTMGFADIQYFGSPLFMNIGNLILKLHYI